jgi:hypothetical protein
MIRKTDTHVIFQCDSCGAWFQGTLADGRKEWKEKDWHSYETTKGRVEICSDCNIDLRDLKDVQHELRSPRPGSSAWRREALWKRLDKLTCRSSRAAKA